MNMKLDRERSLHRKRRLLALTALVLVELVVLATLYQFAATIECQATEAESVCRGLRSLVARALAVLAVGVVLVWARPGLGARLVALTAQRTGAGRWIALHGLGLGLMLAPLAIAGGADMAPMFARLVPFWVAGALAAALGALFWLAPAGVWRQIVGPDAKVVLGALAGGALVPDLADLILPLWWHWPQLTALTFHSVAFVLGLFGPVYVDAPGYIIGVGGFAVHIAQQCSGVEGLALVSGFTLLYAVLFHDRIRPLPYWLVVLPAALLASWGLNVLRISVLILLGDRVSPELAVNGFHSYAGWLFFTLLALGLMWVVQTVSWLHRAPVAVVGVPIRQDWLAARILPFVAFMIGSTAASAFFLHPELGYPVTAGAMAIAVAVFLPALRRQDWAPGGVAVLVGALVGAGWVLTATNAEAADTLETALAGLGGAWLAAWVVVRVVGTVALVPLVEEMFFRGYLLARISGPGPGPGRMALGLVVSSAAFALLHGRWLEAFVAGLVFGLLMLWRGRLADAVWAHVAANAVVAAVAFARGDWSLI